MRIRSAGRALLPGLLTAALVAMSGVTLPGTASAADPVGGPRLVGTDVVSDGPPPPPVSAASYVVADLGSGAVLAAKDPHGAYAPASTLKTLTALTLIPRLSLTARLTPTQQDVDVDGSKVGLVPSMSYSTRDLLTALLVVSANDAATTLADAAGGQSAVAGLMNGRAAALQAHDTHAVNASGLDAPGQTSSAYDLALIARAAMALPDFRAYVAVRRASIPAPGGGAIPIETHDKLLTHYPGAIGIKNGFTEAARASFVGAATRGGHTLVVTLMRSDPTVWRDAAALLDWGFIATAHGAAPVGRLVDPWPAHAATAPGATVRPERSVEQPAPARRAVAQGGSGPLPVVALAAGGLGLLALLRRRAVVRARQRRQRTGRQPRPAGIGT